MSAFAEMSGEQLRASAEEAGKLAALAANDFESFCRLEAERSWQTHQMQSAIRRAVDYAERNKPAADVGHALVAAFGDDLEMVLNLCVSQLAWRNKVRAETLEAIDTAQGMIEENTEFNKERFDTLMAQVGALIAAYDKRLGQLEAPKKLEIDRDEDGHMIGMREIPLTADGSMPAADFHRELDEYLRDLDNGNGNGNGAS